MKKRTKLLLLIATSCMQASMLSGCNSDQTPDTSSQPAMTVGEETSFKVSGISQFKTVYNLEDTIDLSALSIEIYDANNNFIKKINIYDNNVEISGINTDTVGEKELIITYKNFTPYIIKYSVVEYQATLHLNDGAYNDLNIINIKSVEGKYYIGDIAPICNDETKKFAGWFLDEELTQRVEFDLPGYINATNGLELYAGYDTDYSNIFNYEIDYKNNTVKINSINENYKDELLFLNELVIPSTIELYPVVELGNNLFTIYDSNLDMEISYAELCWDLNKITFPENSHVKTIGKEAFNSLYSLMEINFPDSLVTIGEKAFYNCGNISTIEFPEGLQRIDDYAFSNCTGIFDIKFAEFGSLVSIGKFAFENCDNLTKIDFPEGLEQLNANAFAGCTKITEINVPATLTFIGLHAFKGLNQLECINVSEDNKTYCSVNGDLYSKDKTRIIKYCFGKREKTYEIPETVTSIEESCFNIYNGYSNLEEIILPNNLKTIYDEAFAGCSAKFTIPASVEVISTKAFYHYLGSSFSISANNKNYTVDNNGILYSKNYKELICIPEQTTITTYSLDNRVEVIKSYAIVGVTNLRSFKIDEGSNLKQIEEYGFALNSLCNFNCLRINKTGELTFNETSFVAPQDLVSNNYIILVNDECYDSYYEKLSEINLSTMNSTVDSILYSMSNTFNCINNAIENANITTFSHYEKGVEVYGKSSYYDAQYNITTLIGFNEAIYQNVYDSLTDKQKAYLIEVEKVMYSLIVDYFSYYKILSSFETENIKNFLNHYNALPQNVKVEIKTYYDSLNNIYTTNSSYNQQRKELLSEITEFKCNVSEFDIEAYKDLIQRVEETGLENTIIPYSVTSKLFQLKCSNLMYEFVKYKGDYIHHIEDCEIYLYGDGNEFSGNYGIDSLLNNFYTTEEDRKKIYLSDKYDECLSEYLDACSQSDNKITDDINNLDLSLPYNEDTYLQTINEFGALSRASIKTQELISKYNTIVYIYDMEIYLKCFSEITDSNYIEANEINNNLAYINDIFEIVDYLKNLLPETNQTIIDLNTYLNQKEAANTYLNDKLAKVKEEIKNIDMSKEIFDVEAYNKLVSDYESLGSLALNLNYCDPKDTYDYISQYKIICIYYNIYNLAINYADKAISKDNYKAIDMIIYSYYDITTKLQSEGIVTQIESIWYDDFDNAKDNMYYYNTYLQIKEAFDNF